MSSLKNFNSKPNNTKKLPIFFSFIAFIETITSICFCDKERTIIVCLRWKATTQLEFFVGDRLK